MTAARATSRQRGRDFADIAELGILNHPGMPTDTAGLCCRSPMTAPLEAPVPGPAPVSKAIADLRKDDPRTAVELWKRRVAASPEAVAFRYFDKDAWQGMTFREADASAREIAAGLVARGVVPGRSRLHRVADAARVGAVRRRDPARGRRSRYRFTPRTPPSSASSSCATRARRSSSSRTRCSATSWSRCATSCSRSRT